MNWWRRKRPLSAESFGLDFGLTGFCPETHKLVITVDANNTLIMHTHVPAPEVINFLRQMLEKLERAEIRERAQQ